MPSLVIGEAIHAKAKLQSSPKWSPATVIKKLSPRSYKVQINDKYYRRNRVQLRSSKEIIPASTRPRTVPQEIDIPVQPAQKQEISESYADLPTKTTTPRKSISPKKPVTPAAKPATPAFTERQTRAGRVTKLPKALRENYEVKLK